MTRCLLALGSNLGDRQAALAQACSAISHLAGCQVVARSSWHGTVPIGGQAGQGQFLNGALLVDTRLSGHELAKQLQKIESVLGRERVVRWDARTIDIDILLCGDQVIDSDDLIVPHPRMGFRRFVLEPAAEIAGEMLHPTSGWTIGGLLTHLLNSPRLVVVTAPEQRIARWVASELCRLMNCRSLAGHDKKTPLTGVLQPDGGIESLSNQCGNPPAIAVRAPVEVAAMKTAGAGSKQEFRPALIISLEVADPSRLRSAADALRLGVDEESTDWPTCAEFGLRRLGPVASIASDDPATVMQEAQAALRCIWPDIP